MMHKRKNLNLRLFDLRTLRNQYKKIAIVLVTVMFRPLQIITKHNQSYLNIGKIANCATLHRSDTSI